MRHTPRLRFGLAALLICAVPVSAWGPRTTNSIVTMASRMIAKEQAIPLSKREAEIQQGAKLSRTEAREVIPALDDGLIEAIQSEMLLLQAVRTEQLPPYYAYRLGLLGMLTSWLTSPLAEASPNYRDLYYADLDAQIKRTAFTPSKRQSIDPAVYLPRVQREANARTALILKDYEEGIGYKGVASEAAQEDVSRSINAVADVWYTLLTGTSAIGSVAETRIRRYLLNALEYYIQEGAENHIDSAYARFEEYGLDDPELLQRIGDMFYAGEYYARAMREYERLIQLQPDNREVAERIADHYVKEGEEALAEKELEAAENAFERALDVNPLHPAAQGLLLEARNKIDERNKRLEAARAQLAEAERFEERAGTQLANDNHGAAIDLLFEARKAYLSVGSEFREERMEAQSGENRVNDQLAKLRTDLIENAGRLSGAGVMAEVPATALRTAASLGSEAFESIAEKQFTLELQELDRSLAPVLQPGAGQ